MTSTFSGHHEHEPRWARELAAKVDDIAAQVGEILSLVQQPAPTPGPTPDPGPSPDPGPVPDPSPAPGT